MKKTFRSAVPAAAAFVILAALVFSGGWRCPILAFTGIPCPGCGITRAAKALLLLDFAGAWSWNPMIFLLPFPILAAAFGFCRGKGLRWIFLAAAPFLAVWLLFWIIFVVPLYL